MPPWKKRYCLFPQPLGGPRPIWATNIQTGIFVSWGKETADTHSRWDDTLPYKCWPSDIPQHSQAASTPRDKHKCRDKRAGVMTSPLPVYALSVLYAPVLKQRAKLFTWENLVNLYFYYLTGAHRKPYRRQKKHETVEASNKHWNSSENSWSTASNSPRSGTTLLSQLSKP